MYQLVGTACGSEQSRAGDAVTFEYPFVSNFSDMAADSDTSVVIYDKAVSSNGVFSDVYINGTKISADVIFECRRPDLFTDLRDHTPTLPTRPSHWIDRQFSPSSETE